MADEDNMIPEVFVYTDGVVVTEDVVRVRVHPSVTVIPEHAFRDRTKLEEVELCEGLLEIGKQAFHRCKSLKRINIPSTVTKIHSYAFHFCVALEVVELCEGLLEIGMRAFYQCMSLKRIKVPSSVSLLHWTFDKCHRLEEVELSEGLLEIGVRTFSQSIIKQIKIPSSVTLIDNYAFAECSKLEEVGLCEGLQTIHSGAFKYCNSLRHITIPTTVTTIKVEAFEYCYSLRDIAIPSNAVIGRYHGGPIVSEKTSIFEGCTDLKQLFHTDQQQQQQIVHALKHRFDNLPIHKMIYYHSYNNVTSDHLSDSINMGSERKRSLRSTKLNPTGSQQDCLGMTPLHILAASTVRNIDLYRVLIGKYPENLITEDKWGTLPLLYVVWGRAPDEIVRYLVESYKSLYPDHVFNWTEMMVTLSKATVPDDAIRNLLDLHSEFVPGQLELWINELANQGQLSLYTFGLLVLYGYTERVNAIGLKKFRDGMMKEMKKSIPYGGKKAWFAIVRSKLSKYEEEYNQLKEATTILELAMWKNEMNESDTKKRKRTEESGSNYCQQCRIGCSADIVIEHVLPYLLPSSISA